MYKQCVKYSYRKKPSRIQLWIRDGFFLFIVIVGFVWIIEKQ